MGPGQINERLRLVSTILSTLAGNALIAGILGPIVTLATGTTLSTEQVWGLLAVVFGCAFASGVLIWASLKTLKAWIEE